MYIENSFVSPKRSSESSNRLFKYYAGYSTDFVRSTLDQLVKNKKAIILDPWNGAGTTTQVCNEFSLRSIGIDINPVAVVLAKAGSLNKPISEKRLNKLFEHLSHNSVVEIDECDFLLQFFEIKTAQFLRACERGIAVFFKMKGAAWNSDLSVDHAFLLSVFFKVVKLYCKELEGSNPTWIKIPKEECRIKITRKKELLSKFRSEVVLALQSVSESKESSARIYLADSKLTGLKASSVDFIVSSPPYLTRIDYVVSVYIELAILNFPSEKVKQLRDATIGTPTMISEVSHSFTLPSYCLSLMEEIRGHHSVSSTGYYDKFFWQYVNGIFLSSKELYRVVKKNGVGVFVVQDSYYKDIKIDLSQIFIEIFQLHGWKLKMVKSFSVKQNMTYINSRSRNYRKDNSINEHVIMFEK